MPGHKAVAVLSEPPFLSASETEEFPCGENPAAEEEAGLLSSGQHSQVYSSPESCYCGKSSLQRAVPRGTAAGGMEKVCRCLSSLQCCCLGAGLCAAPHLLCQPEPNCQCRPHHTDTIGARSSLLKQFASHRTTATEESLVSVTKGGGKGKHPCLIGCQESKPACPWDSGKGRDRTFLQVHCGFSESPGGFPLTRGSFDQFRWGFSSHM